MKISVKPPISDTKFLTSISSMSGISMSSKTPGRDLEDGESLDKVPKVGSS